MAAQRTSPFVGITRAGLTVAVAFGLTTVFAERAWLGAALIAAIAPHALLAWTEQRKFPAWASITIVLGAAFVFTLYAVEPDTLSRGLPTGETFRRYFDELGNAPRVLRTAIVPVPAVGSALLLALSALWTAGAVSEWSARKLDASIGAIGPSLVMFVTIAALGEGGWVSVTLAYGIAIALYLVALHESELTERRSWFHAGASRQSKVVQGGIAGGVAIVLAAAIVAPLLPGSRGEAWFDYRTLGEGSGGSLLEATTPIVSIKAKLLDDPEHEVFTVDIDEARPAYWRVIALDKYDGSLWTLEDTGESASDLEPPSEPEQLEELVQTFVIQDSEPHWLPAAYHPAEINLENALVVEDSATIYLKPDDPITDLTYEVTSAVPVLTEEEKLAAPPVTDPGFARYLELPENLPDRVRELALRITNDDAEPWAQADALARHLNEEGGYRYNDQVARDHSIDSIDDFLFVTKEGYCEQFASAFAAMARSIGLPTRIAVGYSYGTPEEDVWRVRNKDAHAWPEVYFSGLGWIPLEPTPGRGANAPGGTGDPSDRPSVAAQDADSTETTTPTTAPDATSTPANTVPPGEDGSDVSLGETPTAPPERSSPIVQFLVAVAVVVILGIVLALVGLAVLVALATRRTWSRRHAPDTRGRVLGAWAQALDHLSEAGVEPKPSATPIEFALRHAPAHGAGAAGPPLMELAQLQTAALFAPDAPSSDDADLAWEKVDAIDDAITRMMAPLARWRRRLDPRRMRTDELRPRLA